MSPVPANPVSMLPAPAANDVLDIRAEELTFPAQEEATFRLVFRDQAGKVHTSTHRSTWQPRLGNHHAEERKRRLYRAWRALYDTLGFELISVNLIRVHDHNVF